MKRCIIIAAVAVTALTSCGDEAPSQGEGDIIVITNEDGRSVECASTSRYNLDCNW